MTPTDAGTLSLSTSRADWLVVSLLALSLLGNVALCIGLVRAKNATLAQPAVGRAPLPPQVGDRLPSLDVQRFGGSREMLDFTVGGRPTLLYVFSPRCAWCTKNLDNVKQVFSSARGTHRIVALSLDPELDGFARTSGLDVSLFVRPSEAMFEPYRLGATPMTLVISPAGTVLKSWVGAYSGSTRQDVEAYFGIALPGLIHHEPVVHDRTEAP